MTALAIAPPRQLEQLVLDFLAYLEFERGLSRNTLEAYRSDLLQLGEYLAERGLDVLSVGHSELAAFLTGLAVGADGRSGRGGGDAPAKGRLPALVLPLPAPRRDHRPRPDREPARPAQDERSCRRC